MRSFQRVLSINALWAIGYFVGGLIGHLLETPSSQISPIWPPAGVALAAILVYGNRVLPGVFLGALLTQAYTFADYSSPDTLRISVAVGFLVAVASTLQALFGAVLIRKWVGIGDPLIDAAKIFRFMALAGPASCWVAPSLGSIVLLFSGFIARDGLFLCWFTWWVGDMIGAVILAPLFYLSLTQTKAAWKLRQRYVLYPLLCSLLAVVVIFEYSKRMESGRLTRIFNQQVGLVHGEIQKHQDLHIKTNLALKAFFDSQDQVDEIRFSQYASALLSVYPSLVALEWTPRVENTARRQLEQNTGYPIKEVVGDGELEISRDKPFYFPIHYAEPLAGNERAVGFDISSNPKIKPIIDLAINQGVTVATGGIRLIQDVGRPPSGIVFYSPVYQKNLPLLTAADRQRAFLGFAASVFRVTDELKGILASLPAQQLLVTVRDSKDKGVLFTNWPEPHGDSLNSIGLGENRNLSFAGRAWLINYQPSKAFFLAQQTWNTWWVLLGGFTLCGLTALGALMLTGKTLGIGALVQEKTRDLQETNRHLQVEMEKRGQLQAQQEIKSAVLELLAQNQSLQVILDTIATSCDRLFAGQYCSILLLDANRQSLHLGSAPSLPDFYIQAIEGLLIGPEIGSCGSAAFRKQVVIVEDIFEHPYWRDFRELMRNTPFKSCWSQPILAADGRVLGTFAFYHTRKHAPTPEELEFVKQMAHLAAITIEHKRNEQELLIAATTFQSHEAIVVTDQAGGILRVNKAFCAITGYSESEVIGKNPKILASGIHNEDYFKNMYRSLGEKDQWEGEIWNRNKSGHIFPVWLTLTLVRNPDGEIINYIGIFSDISEIKAAEKEIHDLAYYDPLTHLPNRRLLLERLTYEINYAKNKHCYGALFFLDLDRFKTLNDSLGHHVGDELLIQVAERLKSLVVEGGTVARLGGDEFIVLSQSESKSLQQAAEQARALAEKILLAINKPYRVLELSWHFTASIGVTLFPDLDEPTEAIIQQADTAMYWAKESGRNCISFFNPGMHEYADQRLALEHDLHRALQEGHLRMYYQSQVDHDGKRVGAEALIRWLDPVKGAISPGEFIPLAEESHLILLLGQWVLTEVCRQISVWDLQGNKIDHVAINVSSKQFRQANFVAQVQDALDRSGLAAARLMIELTEGCVIENMDDTIAKMCSLQALGVRISIDDFGIGYSSLLYLKKLPLAQLKIDQSFVNEVANNPSDAVIVETIIHMAKNLGLNVVAEGVETARQLAVLKAKGCLLYQGYYFQRPQPAEQFWLDKEQPTTAEMG